MQILVHLICLGMSQIITLNPKPYHILAKSINQEVVESKCSGSMMN
jgi:hypothetical protein